MRHSCLGFFLAFLVVLIFSVVIYMVNFKATFLNANFVKKELRKANFYTNLTKTIPSFLELLKVETKDPKEAAQFDRLIEFVKKDIKPELLQSEIEKNIDSSYAWLYGKTDKFEINLASSELTKSFEDFFFQGLEAKYPSLPVCTQAQVTNYNIFSENGLECRISGKSFADLKTEFISQFQTENSKLNDSFTYSFQPTATSGTALFWAKGGSWYLVFRIVFYSLSFLLILFLFVIGLMARVSWRSFFLKGISPTATPASATPAPATPAPTPTKTAPSSKNFKN